MKELIERLRKRLRRWLIGYEVQNMTVEVTVVGLDEATESIRKFEGELDRILAKSRQMENVLKEFNR